METMATQSKSNGKAPKKKRTEVKRTTFRKRFQAAIDQLTDAFVMREEAAECIALAYLTGSNAILIGDPGTGKSALIDCFNAHFESVRTFKTLCGSFTTLDELIGPVDIAAFKEGKWARVTDGRMPTANIAFCDEVFKMNDGALNSCLEIFNERTLHGEPTDVWSVVSATNWPEIKSRSEKVAALYDRFLVRCHVLEVLQHGTDDQQLELLDAVDNVRRYTPKTNFTLEELKAARDEIRAVEFSRPVNIKLRDLRRRLAKEGILVSARRMGQLKALCRASAWLDGRTEVELTDLAVLRYGVWDDQEQIATAEAIVNSIDQETVREAIKLVDRARKAFADYTRMPKERQFGASESAVREMQQSARALDQLLQEQPVTKPSKKRIHEAAAEMIAEYDKLSHMVAQLHGLDMGDESEAE